VRNANRSTTFIGPLACETDTDLTASRAISPPAPPSTATIRVPRSSAHCSGNATTLSATRRKYAESGKKKIADRKSHLKRNYGLTLEDFEALLASQGGGCAICGKPDVDHVDHDHVTGRVRGILCFRCNVALGQLDDDEDRARAAANYLTRDHELDLVIRARAVALSG
jgi:hypothetical protein